MKRHLTFQVDITTDVPSNFTREDTIDAVKDLMLSEGLSEYINENNLISEL